MRRTVRSSVMAIALAQLLAGAPAHAAPPGAPRPAPADEAWEGTLAAGPQSLKLVLRVHREGGATRALLDSPDQGGFGIEVTGLSFEGGQLQFAVPSIRGSYRGQLDAAGVSADGQWSQGGARLPLQLRRKSGPVKAPGRPQEPKPPLPYQVAEVGYDNPEAQVHLAATFTSPRAGGKAPAVLLITGSGAEDRDESVFGHKPFLVLADALTRRGVAVLRADDRGVGGSTGDTPTATSEELAGDALAGVAWLRRRPEVDPRRVGLVGHSEGALIAAIAANRSAEVAFVVLLSGPAVPGDELIVEQANAIARATGRTDEAILAKQAETERRLLAIVKNDKDDAVALPKLGAILREAVADSGAPTGPETDRAIEAQLGQLTSRWFRYFVAYDPRPALIKLRIPVLALHGDKDLQVPIKENLPALRGALAANHAAVVRALPGLNHLLQPAKTGAPTEYGAIEQTMSPLALKLIGDFILKAGAPHR